MENTTNTTSTTESRRGKRGKDKQQRKYRIDRDQSIVADSDKLKLIRFNRVLMKLDRITERNNPDVISARIDKYLSLCEQYQIMPTVSGLALSFGIDRATLWDWMSNTRGTIKNRDVVDILKTVYAAINTQYEELLTEGKMIPVSAFFLLQNNHGYKQQTDHVITANNEPSYTLTDITEKAGLLED